MAWRHPVLPRLVWRLHGRARGRVRLPKDQVGNRFGCELLGVGAKECVFGCLLPMVCTSNPYKCLPRSEREQKYIDAFTEKMPRLDGKVALIAASDAATNSGCSLLDLVSNAQLAGATAALVVTNNNRTVSMHPSLLEDWHGYNITIFSGVVSASTALRLAQLQEQTLDAKVHFELKNEIADAWDQTHQLALRSAWPLCKDRKEKLLKRLLATFSLNAGQIQTLKSHFLTIAGGSSASWELLAPPLTQEEGELPDLIDISIGIGEGKENGGDALAAELTDSVATSESHEEL